VGKQRKNNALWFWLNNTFNIKGGSMSGIRKEVEVVRRGKNTLIQPHKLNLNDYLLPWTWKN